MRVDVDEAGHDEPIAGVDLVVGAQARADRNHPAGSDPDVGHERVGAGAVDDGAAADGELDALAAHSAAAAGTSNP